MGWLPDFPDFNRLPAGLLNKVRVTRVVNRVNWRMRLLAFFGVHVGPQ